MNKIKVNNIIIAFIMSFVITTALICTELTNDSYSDAKYAIIPMILLTIFTGHQTFKK